MEAAGLALSIPAIIQLAIRLARTIKEANDEANGPANTLSTTLVGLRDTLGNVPHYDKPTMAILQIPLGSLEQTMRRLDEKLESLRKPAMNRAHRVLAVLRWLRKKHEVEAFTRELHDRIIILTLTSQWAQL